MMEEVPAVTEITESQKKQRDERWKIAMAMANTACPDTTPCAAALPVSFMQIVWRGISQVNETCLQNAQKTLEEHTQESKRVAKRSEQLAKQRAAEHTQRRAVAELNNRVRSK